MIAVVSMKFTDETTVRVTEWLERLGADFFRINVEDIPRAPFGFDPESGSFLVTRGRRVLLSEIRVVWFRRAAPMLVPDLSSVADEALRKTMRRHVESELKGAARAFYDATRHAHWLSHPTTAAPPKFAVLQKARDAGLAIPPTLVTNDKQALRAFRETHGEIILKCITDGDVFTLDGLAYSTFTNIFEPDHIESLPDPLFPVLVQKKIEKAFEVRCFYLDRACHAMAIFSQTNPKTSLDFRHYDFENPNRNVPYLLGDALEEKIRVLMDDLSLETGSLDLIVGADGETYFLEVNPVGMFGMVSVPCNMNLRRKVAEYLIAKDVS